MADQQEPQGSDAPPEPQGSPPPQPDAPDAPPAQPEETTDWKAEARKWEARAKKDGEALKRIQDAVNAKDSEAQQAQAEAAEAKTVALRYRVAAEFKLPPDLADRIKGSTEEEIHADAKALAAYIPTGRTDANNGAGAKPPPSTPPNPNDLLRLMAGR